MELKNKLQWDPVKERFINDDIAKIHRQQSKLLVKFQLNGASLGEVVRLPSGNTLRRILVDVVGTDRISTITIVRGQDDVYQIKCETDTARLEWEKTDIQR